jgi:hypothetical protein
LASLEPRSPQHRPTGDGSSYFRSGNDAHDRVGAWTAEFVCIIHGLKRCFKHPVRADDAAGVMNPIPAPDMLGPEDKTA